MLEGHGDYTLAQAAALLWIPNGKPVSPKILPPPPLLFFLLSSLFPPTHTHKHNTCTHTHTRRFLTLLPPISLTLHLGPKDRDHPSSSLPTFLHTLYDPIVRTLSNPTTIRAYFVAAAIVTIVMYFLVLIRASEMRHRRHMESVIRRQYSVRVGHLRGHKQVRE